MDILGRGPRGTVYRAVDETVGRPVGLKVLSAAAVADTEAWARFRREAESAMRLRHPNIATLYELGEHDEIPFLAFELLEGTDLKRALASGVRPRLTAAVPVILQVLAGLDHAHEHRVLHGEMGTAHIFLPRGQQAKILGFGMARLGAPATTARTEARHDLFAVGLVLHELATGRPAAGAGADLSQAPLGREWGRLGGVLRRALAAGTRGGYPDAASMAGDLAGALVELGGSIHWTTPVDSSLFPAAQTSPRPVLPLVPPPTPAPVAEDALLLDSMSGPVDLPGDPMPRVARPSRLLVAAAAALVAALAFAAVGWKGFGGRAPAPEPRPLPTIPAAAPQSTPTPRPPRAAAKPPPAPAAAAGSVARANEHLENRRYPQALAEARAVLRREPGNAEAQEISDEAQAALTIDDSLRKARAALKSGDKAAAQEALKKGLAVNENEGRLKALWRQATE